MIILPLKRLVQYLHTSDVTSKKCPSAINTSSITSATTIYNNDDNNSTTTALQKQVRFIDGTNCYKTITLFRDNTFPRGASMMFPWENLKNVSAVLPLLLFLNHTSLKTKQQRPHNEIRWGNRRSPGLVLVQPWPTWPQKQTAITNKSCQGENKQAWKTL